MHTKGLKPYIHIWIMTQIPYKKNTQATSYKNRDPTRINIINTRTGEQITRSWMKQVHNKQYPRQMGLQPL